MALRVYHADSNPAIDPFSYRQSNRRAAEIVASGEGRYIRLPDGRTAVQLYRSRASREPWIERLTEARRSSTSPMPLLKIRWPESVKTLRAESLIPNVRRLVSA